MIQWWICFSELACLPKWPTQLAGKSPCRSNILLTRKRSIIGLNGPCFASGLMIGEGFLGLTMNALSKGTKSHDAICLGSKGYNRIHVLKTILNHPWLAMIYIYITNDDDPFRGRDFYGWICSRAFGPKDTWFWYIFFEMLKNMCPWNNGVISKKVWDYN